MKAQYFTAPTARKLLLSLLLLIITGCSSLPMKYLPSQNYNSRVKYIVIHYTAVDYQESLGALVDNNRVSSHYLIPERHDQSYPGNELQIHQLVDESYRAWHAGVSHWNGQDNLNDLSIGIELVNTPECHNRSDEVIVKEPISKSGCSHPNHAHRMCFFPDYDPKQIELLIALIKQLQKQYPRITAANIVGHSDIAPQRKTDPGPRFPWYSLYKAGIGAWYDTETVNKYWHLFTAAPPSTEIIQEALSQYGYQLDVTAEYDHQTRNIISAFQMHFLPWDIDGEPDLITIASLFALLEKYYPERLKPLLEKYQLEKNSQIASSHE